MKHIKDIIVEENASLKNNNTYKVEARCKYLVSIMSLNGLIDLLKYIKNNKLKYMILGNGSNVILGEYFEGVIIKLNGLDYININKDEVKVGAGVMMSSLGMTSVNNGLTGLEWTVSIPGTVGGSIVGNAGAYNSEMFDNLISIKVLDKDLQVRDILKEQIKHAYRYTNITEEGLIVLEGTFKLKKGNITESKEIIEDRRMRRLASQPLDMPSAGSVFRNPEGNYAGKLIEDAGLKGMKVGGAEVSTKHANFIVNSGNATGKDIKNLIKLIQKEIKDKYNVELILEQIIVDWMN